MFQLFQQDSTLFHIYNWGTFACSSFYIFDRYKERRRLKWIKISTRFSGMLVQMAILRWQQVKLRQERCKLSKWRWTYSFDASIKRDRKDVVQLLIDNGADVNLVDNKGKTALMAAAKKGNKQFVKLYLMQELM